MVNTDPYHQQEKGLVPVPTPQGEIMWVHPDLVEGQQWNNVTNRKSRDKAKSSPCNVVCASSLEGETDVPSLIDSEEETIILAAEPNTPLVARTRLGQSYLKKYDEMVTNLPKPLQSQPSNQRSNPWRSKRSFACQGPPEGQSGRIFNTLLV